MSFKTLANEFGKFFEHKVDKIYTSLETIAIAMPPFSPTSDNETLSLSRTPSQPAVQPAVQNQLTSFKPLSPEQVQELKATVAIKYCLLDPIPSSILVQLGYVLLPAFTTMINLSFVEGQFANVWKEALLLPVLKKPGLNVAYKNFRTICNLPFISKLSERAAANQLKQHVDDQGLS